MSSHPCLSTSEHLWDGLTLSGHGDLAKPRPLISLCPACADGVYLARALNQASRHLPVRCACLQDFSMLIMKLVERVQKIGGR